MIATGISHLQAEKRFDGFRFLYDISHMFPFIVLDSNEDLVAAFSEEDQALDYIDYISTLGKEFSLKHISPISALDFEEG